MSTKFIEQGKAAARVRSAGPELLLALKSLADWVDQCVNNPEAIIPLGYARAAIANAEALKLMRAEVGRSGGSAGTGKSKRRSKRHYREAGRKGGLISRKHGAMAAVKPEGQTP